MANFITLSIAWIIYYGTLIPIYFMAANQRLPKKNIILGVTVPYAHHDAPDVLAISAEFLRRLRILTLCLALLGIPLFFIPYMSIQFLIFLTLFLFLLLGDGFVFIQANRAMAALKQRSDWQETKHTVPAAADIRAMEEKSRPLPRLAFALPCLVAAIPLIPLVREIIQGDVVWIAFVAYALTAAFLPLLLILSEAIRRQNAEVVGTNSDLNVILTRIRRREYLRCMLLCMWLLALTAIGVWFQALVSELFFLALISILTIVIVVYAFRAEFAVRRAQEKFTKLAGDTLTVDDDAHWLWGMFYHNREDKRYFIKDRIGMNMSVNLGRMAGKITMLLTAVVLLSMPLIGVWMVAEEFSPIRYDLDGHVITVTHLRARQFDLGDDFEAELLDALPAGTRTMGSEIGTLRKGYFNFQELGPAYVTLHTDRPPFLVLTTAEGQVLVFNDDPVFAPLLR